jgi:hypothetical protein
LYRTNTIFCGQKVKWEKIGEGNERAWKVILDRYLEEINMVNPLGSAGKLAK